MIYLIVDGKRFGPFKLTSKIKKLKSLKGIEIQPTDDKQKETVLFPQEEQLDLL
jgi:hypothetical protein